MEIKKELLIEKAQEGYAVCNMEGCPLRDHCLRWLTGQHVPSTRSTYRCVNPHFEGVATAKCPMYRNDQKVRFAKGMLHIFTDDMPKRVESEVRRKCHLRKYLPVSYNVFFYRAKKLSKQSQHIVHLVHS